MPHWHRDSLFGPGPRRPLDREQRARFRFLLSAHRRVRRITPLTEHVGEALVRRLSVDGRCDPCHDTLAADVGCAARTVRRALDALRVLGLVLWQRRIVRTGNRVWQASNAYLLTPAAVPNPPVFRALRSGGHFGRGILKEDSILLPASPREIEEARSALARRRAVVE